MNQTKYFGRKKASGFYIPSSNDPYTFLTSILSYNVLGKRIGYLANAKLDAFGINVSTYNVESGLDFLKDVAEKQRAHEMNFINHKIQVLEQLGTLGEEELKIISDLKQINSGNFDYKTFIEALNMTITNIQKYKNRIKGFNKHTVVNTPQLNMVTGLNTMLGTITERRQAFYLSQEELIRQLALEFFKRPAGQEFIQKAITSNGIDDIAAALGIITQQLAQFIYDSDKLHYKSKKYYKDVNEFQSEFDRLIQSFDDFAHNTNIESLYGNQQLLDEVKELYGITIDPNMQLTNKGISLNAAKELRNVKTKLNTDIFSQQVKDLMKRIKINFKYNSTQLSYENELVSALAPAFNSHSAVGAKNLGTDMLLGWMTTTIENGTPPQNNDKIAQTLQNIKTKLSTSTNYNGVDKVTNAYLTELSQLDNALTEIEKGFIFHETTKNYNTLERGHWPGGMNSFSGREMKLSNYINSIQAMNLSNINTNALQLIALNLATDALGNSLKEPLEHLLAIFGGIIMFDDFALIGREVTEGMQFNNIENIHLYRLQDTYFPASMFLDATYKAMNGLKNELLDGNGFTADINKIPTINYYITEGVPDTSYGETFKERWEGVRTYADKNTTVHLHFAANFLSLMAQLLP